MFAKKNRLSRKAFNRFFASGARSHTALVQLVYAPQTESAVTSFQVAVSVSKKVSKRAVDRNRLRRQCYAIARSWHQETPLVGVYIMLVKPPALEADFGELESAVRSLLKKSYNKRS